MKKGKMANSDGIVLPNKTTMKGLKEGDSYKYLRVILPDGTKHHEMKDKVETGYYKRLTKILETKLNDGNIITGINTCPSSLLDWTGRIRANRRIGQEDKKINDNALGIES